MSFAEFYAAFAAWGTWALVGITFGAVIVGWRAANTANATLRLEVEPRLVVRVVNEARIFARQGLQRFTGIAVPGTPSSSEPFEPLDQSPVYLLDGKLGSDNLRKVTNGFAIRMPTAAELNQTQPGHSLIWPALHIEIHNVGRSPAIKIGLNWSISGPMFNYDRSFEEGLEVREQIDEATIVVDAVAPNDRTYIWIGNATGTPFTLRLKSTGYQRDPFDLDSGKTTPISVIAVSTFRLSMADRAV
ncbi:MAG: hypothetical protein JO083_06165 [Candidatus Eremiobacteraeota bacterium]|nr:hypothetical protein [Candidatus Eremiobacteraeota bacterium]